MATTKTESQMPNWVKQAIDKQIEFELETIVEDVKKRLDEKRDEILARAMVKVSNLVSYEKLGEEIVITVKKLDQLNNGDTK